MDINNVNNTRQIYTSANTSINKNKLPAIYNKVNFQSESTVLDYGCGKYIDHIKAKVKEQGCEYIPYDPFNLPDSKIPESKVDYAVCSNVLNVINDMETIKEIITILADKANEIYISVYEGDGTGIGKITGKDNYQRNEKLSVYVDLIRSMGYVVKIKNKIIYFSKKQDSKAKSA